VYLVTRRCTQRQLWLRPDAETNAIMRYCYAVAAARSGVRLAAMCVMGNHHHDVVYDERGELPRYLHWLHAFTARCVNAKEGRTGAPTACSTSSCAASAR
jgi:REP element-mobilizing transposase RayT